jgi:hypothetical protein
MTPLLFAAAVRLGAATPEPATQLDPARVTPGVAGFAVFLALALASWFL